MHKICCSIIRKYRRGFKSCNCSCWNFPCFWDHQLFQCYIFFSISKIWLEFYPYKPPNPLLNMTCIMSFEMKFHFKNKEIRWLKCYFFEMFYHYSLNLTDDLKNIPESKTVLHIFFLLFFLAHICRRKYYFRVKFSKCRFS